uniref:Immediate early response 2b n=1 Tax=Amphilophus citrinellus TaxID=61819 RepID=A0A3Q0SVR3_AMPCI
MEVNIEARRILAVSISKLYASRTQRGGLRLHRSLLLSLVMRSARDIYHSSRESEGPSGAQSAPEEPMDTSSSPGEQTRLPEPQQEPAFNSAETDKENLSPAKQSRKRRGKASAAPDFLPSKRARLEPGEERYEFLTHTLLIFKLKVCWSTLGHSLQGQSFITGRRMVPPSTSLACCH